VDELALAMLELMLTHGAAPGHQDSAGMIMCTRSGECLTLDS
jgi:hypothetical protein